MDFYAGQIVKLKGGGPDMTVERINGSVVDCAWFSMNGLHRSSFEMNVLQIVEPAPAK